MPLRIEQRDNDVLLWIKAVPGASRDQVAGVVGDRLKVRIAAPAEGGRANEAICKVIARALGIKTRHVMIESGHTNPEKVVRVTGMDRRGMSALVDPGSAAGPS